MSSTIFTIGYGNRSIQTFIHLLKKYEIEILIDIRTSPFSRFNPDYRIQKFEVHLIKNEIRYLFLGKELGGKPTDLSCYINQQIDYDSIKTKQFFRDGIEEVKALYAAGFRVAMMCAEQSPLDCHRKWLVGDYLESTGLPVCHIDKTGDILNSLF
jgi:uncharacterized protein (DUF488 family)